MYWGTVYPSNRHYVETIMEVEELRLTITDLVQRSRDRPISLNHLKYPTNFYFRTIETMCQEIGTIMAKHTNRRSPSQKNSFDVTFVDVRLSAQDKEQFTSYMLQEADELNLNLADFIADDHKFSVTWDDENKCFIASATCRDEGSINHNCCISSRSQEWYEAMQLTVFKATVLLGGKAWTDAKTDKSWG